ncbi:hypothetical protein HPULCUR_010976 [Helicostylum pulchrum]|uniref:Uncharacterized protein n=1 Tax=Helicostylum pulchrum TaxID=562976 RepID=A0ABP9YFM3_9FUNG
MDTSDESIEDRILRWAATDTSDLPDFPDDKSDLPSDFEYNPEDYEDDEEEIVEEISENELLKYLGPSETLLMTDEQQPLELNTTDRHMWKQIPTENDNTVDLKKRSLPTKTDTTEEN